MPKTILPLVLSLDTELLDALVGLDCSKSLTSALSLESIEGLRAAGLVCMSANGDYELTELGQTVRATDAHGPEVGVLTEAEFGECLPAEVLKIQGLGEPRVGLTFKELRETLKKAVALAKRPSVLKRRPVCERALPSGKDFSLGWTTLFREGIASVFTRPAPVEGDVLPSIGSKVFIHLSSSDSWVEQTVVGYYAWNSLEKNPGLHRIFVHVVDESNVPNARMLCDVRTTKP